MAEPKRHRLSVRELVGRGKIVHMNCGSINERAPCGPAARNRPTVEIYRYRSAMGRILEPPAFSQPEICVVRSAKPAGSFHNGVEHRLKLVRRAADDVQHVACSGL